MQGYFAIATLLLLMTMVLSRVLQLRKMGIKAMKFGQKDKKDFLIIPFVLLFFYIVYSSVFNLPKLGTELFRAYSYNLKERLVYEKIIVIDYNSADDNFFFL